jgi:ribosomal protein RSM22 (predicted rRNA methylase)
MKNSLWPLDFATQSAEFLNFYFSILQDVVRSNSTKPSVTKKPSDAVLVSAIQKLSDKYQNHGQDHSDLWSLEESRLAYLYYFLPLNALRLLAVFLELKERGFQFDAQPVLDFGSGPGTTWLVMEHLKIRPTTMTFVEKSKSAIDVHRLFVEKSVIKNQKFDWQQTVKSVQKNTSAVFSYSLNEVVELPKWTPDLQTILILEPSTQSAGRNLMEKRQRLIEMGFSIVAPCTHEMACPLLKHSKKDWCHMRVHTKFPDLCKGYMEKLPMNNDTLTFSYLVAAKQQAVQTDFRGEARVIGDTLYEKGKVRQAICRNDEREFLGWLTKFGEPEQIPRGSICDVSGHEKIGNELRSTRSKDC